MDTSLQSVVTGFILTTVLGGLLGAALQRTQWNRQARLDIAKQGYVDATTLLEDVFTLIDTRYYRLYRWYACVEGGDSEDKVLQREAEYFAAVHVWNEKLRTHHQSIRRLLGVSHALSFLNYQDDLDREHPTSLHYRFVLCTVLMHRLTTQADVAPRVWSEIEKLNWHLTDFAQETTSELMERSQSLRRLRAREWSKQRSPALTSRPDPQHPSGSGPT